MLMARPQRTLELCVCGPNIVAHCFSFAKNSRCFLALLFIVFYDHLYSSILYWFADAVACFSLPLSLCQDPGRKDKYRHTHTDRHTYVYRRQWILMSWLDSASCFANSQTASYEFMSYKNSCWDAEMLLPLAGESETRDSSRRGGRVTGLKGRCDWSAPVFDYFCYCFYAFRIFVDFMLLYILIMRQMDDKHK